MNIKLVENQTVQNLRRAGYRTKVTHSRFSDGQYTSGIGVNPDVYGKLITEYEIRQMNLVFNPKGGRTVIQITAPDGKLYEGKADCSRKDAFNRKMGVQIALGRLQQIN